jgi:hypothetical protein
VPLQEVIPGGAKVMEIDAIDLHLHRGIKLIDLQVEPVLFYLQELAERRFARPRWAKDQP